MNTNKKYQNSASENAKETEDFKNIPAASDKKNPPTISKEDIKKSSDLNKSGKTENTDNQ